MIARQAAESKAARAQRHSLALDSQLRIATETAQRLQREARGHAQRDRIRPGPSTAAGSSPLSGR